MARKKIAKYNSNPNYLDYLTALRKFFTNDTDIIPIIQAFNFYINGVYGTPYTDLFRMYDENLEDIHGTEKTKQLIDDGTIGIINNQIYNNGNGSLITSLENLRVYMLDRSNKYTIAYNPFINAYAEALKPKINVLETANPVVTSNGIEVAEPVINELAAPEILTKQQPLKTVAPKKTTVKQKLNSIFSKLSFLSYKQSKKYKKQQTKQTIIN